MYWVDPELALSLIDSNNCRVSITTTINDFDYELVEGQTLGPCGACRARSIDQRDGARNKNTRPGMDLVDPSSGRGGDVCKV